ncbi:MAG: CPBP family intramembrane glutamic endopeptidase [Anaerolineae bacterium]
MHTPCSPFVLWRPIAAAILSYRRHGPDGVKALAARALDYRRIEARWYAPILLLKPAITFATYAIARLSGRPLPDRRTPLRALPVKLPVFLAGGLTEELGWSGYALEPMQERWGALKAGLVLGIVWATWHVVPSLQIGRPVGWLAWQYVDTVATRVIIVWLYNSTGKSVAAATLFHAITNVSVFVYPYYGSHYDPRLSAVLTWLAAGAAVWSARTRNAAKTRKGT